MTRPIDIDRAAAILVDAAYRGDEAAAETWGITTRTVKNYRARLADDPRLSLAFHDKRRLVERDWAASLPAAIHAGTEFIQRAARQGNPKDPNMVSAVAGSMKLLAEIMFTKQVLDARFGVENDVRDSGQRGTARPQIAEVVEADYSDSDE